MGKKGTAQTVVYLRALLRDGRRQEAVKLINQLLAQGRRGEVIRLIEALLPADQADLFLELPAEEQERLLAEVRAGDAADILEEVYDEAASALAEALDAEVLGRVLNEMEPDEAADLLGDVRPALASEALKSMERAEAVRPLLRYPDDSAGGVMTSRYYALSQDATAGEALRAIRSHPQRDHEIPYVYALDETGKVVGIVRLADLIRVHPEHRLATFMRTELVTVRAEEDREVAARLVARYDLMAIPVVDATGRLLGVVTADDAMATLEKEVTEDIYAKAAIAPFGNRESAQSQLLVRGSLWRVWRVRIPFLIITMLGGMLAGSVIDVFEEALQAATMLAFFIPVVMGMGGNAGTQSSTIFTRALVLGHIDMGRFGKHLLREVAVGGTMGLLLGALAILIAGLWVGFDIGIVVGLAMACAITVAVTLGFLVPFVMVKLGIDQTVATDPFVTTIKDITGLMIYFTLARLFAGHLL
jgi:magnesium transporter